jgi:hypothetical protein
MCPTTMWKELKLASRVGDFTIIVWVAKVG